MNSHGKILSLFLLLCSANVATASYLRMIPSYQLRMDEVGKKVSIQWTVKNDGDESAEDVVLDFPTLGIALTMALEIPAQSTASKVLTLPFSQLGIKQRGNYALAYRVMYKDMNLFSFSAPYLLSFALPPEASSALQLDFEQPGTEVYMVSQSQKKVHLKIHNITNVPVILNDLEPLAPVELSVRTRDFPLPVQLMADEQKEVVVTLSATQTLVGSVYAIGLIASGTINGLHFSEPVRLVVRIRESFWNPRNILLGIILALGVALLLSHWMKKILPTAAPKSKKV